MRDGRGIGAFKRIEDLLQEFFGHADAVILTAEAQIATFILHLLSKGDQDLTVFVGIFDGVIDDIDEDLPETQRIAIETFIYDIFCLEDEMMMFLFHLRSDYR